LAATKAGPTRLISHSAAAAAGVSINQRVSPTGGETVGAHSFTTGVSERPLHCGISVPSMSGLGHYDVVCPLCPESEHGLGPPESIVRRDGARGRTAGDRTAQAQLLHISVAEQVLITVSERPDEKLGRHNRARAAKRALEVAAAGGHNLLTMQRTITTLATIKGGHIMRKATEGIRNIPRTTQNVTEALIALTSSRRQRATEGP
jgi:hypothetical protein